MTDKEKARAYDRALEIAKAWYKLDNNDLTNADLETLFPGLKESEDKRMREEVIAFIKSVAYAKTDDVKRYVAWLEKQGKSDKIVEKAKTEKQRVLLTETDGSANIDWDCRSLDDVKTLLKCGLEFIRTIEINKQILVDNRFGGCSIRVPTRYDKGIKQGEQKPDDKAEQKFHEGDWVVTDKNNVVQIKTIDGNYYALENKMKFTIDYVDKCWHLWTIQDARDGDVLSYVTDEGDLWIMIYQSLYEPYEGHVHYHALLVNDNFSDKGTCCICINDLHSATKEQRDTLFAKMKEAGYEWNPEKKELKKVEPKKDIHPGLTDFEYSLKHIMEEAIECGDTHNLKADADMLLRLVQKPAKWSEEDDNYINDLIKYFSQNERLENTEEDIVIWLKSLKDHVHPGQEWKQKNTKGLTNFENAMMHIGNSFFGQHAGLDPNDTNAVKEQANLLLELVPSKEWNEKDEKLFNSVVWHLRNSVNNGDTEHSADHLEDWLNSLRPKTGMPDAEQMNDKS